MNAPLGILLRSGTHEAVHYAHVMATSAAAIGRPAVLFCTNAGLVALLRQNPLIEDPREALLAERKVGTLAVLAEAAAELGVRRIACEAGMRAEAIGPQALAEGVEVAGVVTFLEAVGAGQIVSL
ncbi:DsrE family protein [Acetobacteraceae bacterium H6797]|nr:DsrE family protein [Acetobacteraceae bacterium H6797]